MDLMRKGLIKGKGYILTEQITVWLWVQSIWIFAEWRISGPASSLSSRFCSLFRRRRRTYIAHNLALLGRDVHLISAIGTIFTARHYWKKRAARA